MKEKIITLKIKTLRNGQEKKYGALFYEYEIEADGMYEYEVKNYCLRVLKHCDQTLEQWDKTDANSYFAGYYTFEKTGENKYRYFVYSPSTH